MLNYNSSIKNEKKYSGLAVKEISPIMKLMFKQTMENHFGNNALKLEKNLILPLMEQKQCTY